jgi:hypothetical protein
VGSRHHGEDVSTVGLIGTPQVSSQHLYKRPTIESGNQGGPTSSGGALDDCRQPNDRILLCFSPVDTGAYYLLGIAVLAATVRGVDPSMKLLAASQNLGFKRPGCCQSFVS